MLGLLDTFLLMLKLDIVFESLYSRLIVIIKSLMTAKFRKEYLKSVCTYLSYTLPGNLCLMLDSDLNEFQATQIHNVKLLSKAHIIEPTTRQIKIRNMFLEMLCQLLDTNGYHISVFSSTIKHRWILMFTRQGIHPYTSILATRIFCNVWIGLDSMYYTTKYRENLIALGRELSCSFYLIQLYPLILCLILGVKVSNIPLDMPFDVPTMIALFHSAEKPKRLCPEACRVLMILVEKVLINDCIAFY